MKMKTLCAAGLLLGMLLFGSGPGSGSVNLMVQQIRELGARQWLRLVADTVTWKPGHPTAEPNSSWAA
jgi:hypothetical protein